MTQQLDKIQRDGFQQDRENRFKQYATEAQKKALERLQGLTPDTLIDGPMFGGDGAWVARSEACNLWYAIETDGYIHT